MFLLIHRASMSLFMVKAGNRISNATRQGLAKELGIAPERLDALADDYRIRTLQGLRKSAGTLPVKMHKVPPKMLARFQAEYGKQSPTPVKQQPVDLFAENAKQKRGKNLKSAIKTNTKKNKNTNKKEHIAEKKQPDNHYARAWNEGGLPARQAILDKAKVKHSAKLDWDKHKKTVQTKIAAVLENAVERQNLHEGEAVQHQWDSLSVDERQPLMKQAGLKIPPKMNWDKMSNSIRAKLEAAMTAEQQDSIKKAQEGNKNTKVINKNAEKVENSAPDTVEKTTNQTEKERLQAQAVDAMREVIKTKADVTNALTRPDIGRVEIYSIKGEAGKSKNTVATLKAELVTGDLGKYIERLIEDGKVRIVAKADNAPDGVQGWTSDEGTITLVADEIARGEAQAVLLHEMFHQGVKPLIGEESWGKLMNRLDSLYRQFEAREQTGSFRQRESASSKHKAKRAQ